MNTSIKTKYLEDILTAVKNNQPSKLQEPISKILYAKANNILNKKKEEIIREY